MNETLKTIHARRSIRTFLNQKVEDEKIKEILYAAVLAPSAHNKQPWEFVVIKNTLLKDKIADLLIESDHKNGKESSSIKTAQTIKSAPVMILVFNKYDEFPLYQSLSIGASIQNMLLAATSLNLGSLWIGNVLKIEKEIRMLLNKNEQLMSAVLLGYTDENPVMPDRQLIDAVTEWKE